MRHCAGLGAPLTNNLSFPLLMNHCDAKWMTDYLKSNHNADTVISKGGPDDWAVNVAMQLVKDDEVIPHAIRKKLYTELEHYNYMFRLVHPFFVNSDSYRGMEKLLNATLRLMIKDLKNSHRLLSSSAYNRQEFRQLRDMLIELPDFAHVNDIKLTIENFLQNTRQYKYKKHETKYYQR